MTVVVGCRPRSLKADILEMGGVDPVAPHNLDLNSHWFLTFADAAEKMEAWLRYDDEERPHGAIGYKPLVSLLNHGGDHSPPP